VGTVLALYIASVKEFVRDRMAIFWTMAFPVLFIVLFGVIFNAPSSSYDIGIVNNDTGSVGQQFIKTFTDAKSGSSNLFKITTYTSNDAALADLRAGKHDMIVDLPSSLSSAASQNIPAQISVYYDPSKSTSAQIELGVVQGVTSSFAAQYLHAVPILNVQAQSIQTHNLTYIAFLVPGILAMSLMQLGLFGTAPALVSLRQDGVLRRLGATPLPRWKLLISQVLMRLTVGVVQTALIIGIGIAWFNVQVEGSWLALTGVVLLGALTFVGIGYLIASISRTVEAASGISSGVNFPMMFLSGIFFPIASLVSVPVLAVLIKIMPLTYLGDALRQIAVQGVPTFPLAVDVAVLAGWFIVCAALSVRFFKWE
jgi:ABC-2 type transport system permease protein